MKASRVASGSPLAYSPADPRIPTRNGDTVQTTPTPLSQDLKDTLSKITTASITTILLKKGLRNVWMRGTRPIKPGQGRLVGRAFTLRFVPAREDLATPESWSSPISTRAAIEAIDRGQVEAAQTIGMGWGLTMRRVLLPQAFRAALPPFGNVMIMMLKDSSQASTITVAELALQGKLIASATFKNTSVFTLVALMYLALSLPLILIVRHFEKQQAGRR